MSNRFQRPTEQFDAYTGLPTRLSSQPGPVKIRELSDDELLHLRAHLERAAKGIFAEDRARAAAKLEKLNNIIAERGI